MSLVVRALECGAAKAEIIPQGGIVLSAAFRDICKSNGCGKYGRCYMCPPDAGDIEALMKRARGYPKGLLYQTIGQIEDSFDFEGMMEAGQAHVQCSLRMQAALTPMLREGALHLSTGGCRVCDTCAKEENLPCRFPGDALASLESHGIDVYQTTLSTSLRYNNGQNTVTFFGLMLFEEGDYA